MASFTSIWDVMKKIKNFDIFIPVFNNPSYLKNIVEYLTQKQQYRIVILDNHSTYPPMLDLLNDLAKDFVVIQQQKNLGPRHIFDDPVIFSELPQRFFITDPDMGLNPNMPLDFIDILFNLTLEFKVFKAGVALNINLDEPILYKKYVTHGKTTTIREEETRFYSELLTTIDNNRVYKAPIDTTFTLCNKKYFSNGFYSAVRVADNFLAEHYGWYTHPPITQEEQAFYKESVKSLQFASTEVIRRGDEYNY